MTATLTFLGTADSKGVPRFWCDCPVCVEARHTGLNRRTRTGFLLRGPGAAGEDTVLLDVSQDLHGQLAQQGPVRPSLVLVSHAHSDHLLGLADLLDYGFYAGAPLRVMAPPKVIPQIAERFAYAFRRQAAVRPLPVEGVVAAGFRIRAFEVPHGANGTSHGFHLDRPGWRCALLTDSLAVPPDTARDWLANLDLLILGTSFPDESGIPRASRAVYDIREALELPWAQAARRVILTHLAHGVDRRTLTLPADWTAAYDGLSLSL